MDKKIKKKIGLTLCYSQRTHEIISILSTEVVLPGHSTLWTANLSMNPGPSMVEVQWVVAPSLEIFLSTMKPGNFQSCLLDIPYLMTWHFHCWIPYINYETFRSLCIIQKLHLQYEVAVALMFSSDDQITAHTHTCFFCSFFKFSSLCKALGSIKGSSALCLFHSFGCRYQAPYRIFTCFGLQVFYGK